MRPEKEGIVNEICGHLESSDYIFLADYRGLTVEQLSDLRSRLRLSDACLQVFKNAFLECAVKDDGISGFLEGPTAMIFGGSDITQVAKALKNFKAENGLPIVKGGKLGDRLLSSEEIWEMASIPSRDVLLGKLAGTICAPMTQVVGVMKQKVLSLLYVLRAIEKGMARDRKG